VITNFYFVHEDDDNDDLIKLKISSENLKSLTIEIFSRTKNKLILISISNSEQLKTIFLTLDVFYN
jgi:hypothetical protein